MSQRSLHPFSCVIGLLAGLGLALFLGAARSPHSLGTAPTTNSAPRQETPPDINPGTKLYRVTVTNPQALPGLPPTAPLEILETRGGWARVESPSLANDPFWLNLNELVRYQTDL